MQIEIPGTLPGLNELIAAERAHRQKGAELKRKSEMIVLSRMKSLGKWRAKGPVRMIYFWYEPNRRRDKDNISAFGRKIIQDALVKGGYIRNDGWSDIDGFEDRFFVDKKNPRIIIQIYEFGE